MRHPKLVEWDNKFKSMFDEIDDYLEDKYHGRFSLHPNRAERGQTSNKSADGLFNVGVSFSAGYGSEYGRGYVVEISLSTLENISNEVRKQIEDEVVQQIEQRLPHFFPDRELQVDKDGRALKIYGDLSLR
ncbi:hypothetical protein [Spirochaeta cellobiosiphila]|uniref:hypothetical protein n=1 Tax=Spirochaeta cellobiosiphila TaxID=504483 RepID=UPI000426FEE6|nr:hypothetical protein [Spirochaeta cellobiosiphila]